MATGSRARRAALIILVGIAIVGGAAAFALNSPTALAWFYNQQAHRRFAQQRGLANMFDGKALRVVLCGTSSPVPDAARAKACTVVIAGDHAFVVDTGPESWKTLALANFPADRIAGVMLTHFHSDHIGDLGEFRLQTWVGGRKQPLPVYGGAGVEKIVDGVNLTYALDDGYRAAHHGHDVAPIEAAPLIAKPFKVGSSDTHDQAETILEDGDLKVTAFEVNHTPVRPAVGYRFDYKGRSVVVSGDTIKWPNVARWSHNADVLVHEAQNQNMREIIAAAARDENMKSVGKIFEDIETYHSSPRDAAEIANQAGVRLLVFTHFTPPLVSGLLDSLFFEGVSDIRPASGWVAGFDGMRIDLPIGSDKIEQSALATGIFR
ncbi:MAG: MBL fold metallo-hydrolase [Hyphomicrobiales bacterium]|nr:MBL fold metallo-hydrolase [Hyphomicrobiales bacterium]